MVSISTAATPWKAPLPMRAFLLSILVFCLKAGVARALRPSSYSESTAEDSTLLEDQPKTRAASKDMFTNNPGSHPSGGDDKVKALRQLLELEPKLLRSALTESLRSLSDQGIKGRNSSSNIDRCIHNIEDIINGIERMQPWALQVIDAMGKPSPAVSEGNFIWTGAYDMCLSIRSNISHPHLPNFSGRYCNVRTKLDLELPWNIPGSSNTVLLGLCVPDTCSESHLTTVLNEVLVFLETQLEMSVECVPSSNPLDAKAIVAIVVCSILLLMMVLGTLADLRMQFGEQWFKPAAYELIQDDSEHCTTLKVLVAFSVYTNGSKLLSTHQPAGSLTCLNGIRFMSITWVVLFHTYTELNFIPENFGRHAMESASRLSYQLIIHSLVSVDSFFVLSGVLVAYLTLKELDKKKGQLNWALFYFHRFWRITPPYMLVIMVYACLGPRLVSGPFSRISRIEYDKCASNWWTNLLYVNNMVNAEHMCMRTTWYLAVDMQFYCVLSPLVIMSLYRVPVAGYVVAGVLIVTHCVTNAALTVVNRYDPGLFVHMEGGHGDTSKDWLQLFYAAPYTRWGAYVIGMLTGYFLHVTKCKLTIRWQVKVALWCVTTATALAVVFGLYGVTFATHVSLGATTLYNALHRVVWSVSVCWVIIACVSGNGGVVNTILSWSAFVPLSRVTYCIYLLHLLVIEQTVFNLHKPFYYTDINFTMTFLGILLVSCLAAAVISLAFEVPMTGLEKILLSACRSRGDTKQQEQQNPIQQTVELKNVKE